METDKKLKINFLNFENLERKISKKFFDIELCFRNSFKKKLVFR